ncbi:MAG: hypothetical protein M3340_19815 [Actinomycetota bacterium]|nr:hypothetical protein [Actinomycetota bacterium]
MYVRALLVAAIAAALALSLVGTAAAAEVSFPKSPAPSWLTEDVKQRLADGESVPVDDHQVYDVCPGAAIHENGVGTGTCLVVPFGCTANFVYTSGSGPAAQVATGGQYYLGTAGHCTEKVGEPVYGAVATPGVGPAIQRIGTVSKRIEDYPDDGNVRDFASIKIDDGLRLYPQSPVGGPQGIYDGCDTGAPLKYYGHGYEVAVAQGKPGVGVAEVWYRDGFGWIGPINGGDSGSGVIHADNRAIGDLTATAIVYLPAFFPGESIGSRITWILSFTGHSLVNQDFTLSRDTTACFTTVDGGDDGGGGGGSGGGGKGGGNGGGGGKGGKPKA